MKGLEFKISLTRKRNKVIHLASIVDTGNFIRNCFDLNTIEWDEQVIVVCLDNRLKVIGWHKISHGGLNQCLIDIRKLFQIVLLSNATRFIVAHNHPSGDLTPSKNDIETTKKISNAAKIMNLQFLDHFIVTKNSCDTIQIK